jgi:nucleotide-binding universal stress UspA family protein
MPGYQRIVVAYDGSPRALDALALALRLRDPEHGALLPACVVPSRPWPLPGLPAGSDAALRDAQEMLADIRAEMPVDIPVSARTPYASSPARGLTELAEAEHADLIVIGSAAGGDGRHVVLTRTAGRLLQGAPCAVAIAAPGVREIGPFRHVGIALDDSPEAATATAVGFAIARMSGGAATLYSAIDRTTQAVGANFAHTRIRVQERLDHAADGAPPGVNPQTMLLVGPPAQVIGDACEGIVDLLVTGSRGYGPLQRALLGSVSEDLVKRATHAVLVIPRVAAPASPAVAPAEAVEVG